MQKNPRFRQYAKRFAIVWVGIATVAVISPHASSNSTEDCWGAWGYSSANANHSCNDERITWFQSRQACWVRAKCLTGVGNERNNSWIEVSLDDVYNLKNCSGELTVGDCPT